MSSLCENIVIGSREFSTEGLIPDKIYFRDKDGNRGNDMVMDLSAEQISSWKDKLVSQSSKFNRNGLEEKEDFDLLEGDIQKSIVNEMCTFKADEHNTGDESLMIGLSPKNQNLAINNMLENRKTYGSWMLVEKKSRVFSGYQTEVIDNRCNKRKGIMNGDHQKRNLKAKQRSSAASGLPVGLGATSTLANDNHLGNGEFRKNIKEANERLNLNGSLEEFEPFNGNDGDSLESNFAPCSTMEGMIGIASEVMVGNLDPKKHTAVIFKVKKD
ncbi:hypothetical protein GOBAR_AA04408 [Gossypium barbadense]|uniref:Uncharacterized protein n=1 Tax=Gossypium barbadense TaxID=3634 RepID=A0A2P5YKP7_GOSBA|nr:hypothetical protein GOBAR_AA04408 [Gossypium barbadense]